MLAIRALAGVKGTRKWACCQMFVWRLSASAAIEGSLKRQASVAGGWLWRAYEEMLARREDW